MKLTILAFALALHPMCHAAEWLTLTGEPGNAASDYFQFNPDSLKSRGSFFQIEVRANRAMSQKEAGRSYRSFEGVAEVDCAQKTARYTYLQYFDAPNFAGNPSAVLRYGKAQIVPVRCWMTIDGRPAILIKAACEHGSKPV